MRRSLLSAVLSLPDLFVSFSFSLIFALAMAHPGQAAEFACVSGDVACLISSINTANGNSQVNTITLEAGSYTLTDVNNDTNGPNGLPSITSTLSIQGPDAETTVIERAGNAPAFRLVHVAAAGALTLEGLTLRFGATGVGGGLFNDGGTVTLRHSILSNNSAGAGAGGLFNDQGTVTISHSIVSGNNAGFFGVGGGIYNGGGTLALVNSSLSSNWAETCGGLSGGSGTSITNSTIAGNRATGDGLVVYLQDADNYNGLGHSCHHGVNKPVTVSPIGVAGPISALFACPSAHLTRVVSQAPVHPLLTASVAAAVAGRETIAPRAASRCDP